MILFQFTSSISNTRLHANVLSRQCVNTQIVYLKHVLNMLTVYLKHVLNMLMVNHENGLKC